jgi:hypothetical protein
LNDSFSFQISFAEHEILLVSGAVSEPNTLCFLNQNPTQLKQILFIHIGAGASCLSGFAQSDIFVSSDDHDARIGKGGFDLLGCG